MGKCEILILFLVFLFCHKFPIVIFHVRQFLSRRLESTVALKKKWWKTRDRHRREGRSRTEAPSTRVCRKKMLVPLSSAAIYAHLARQKLPGCSDYCLTSFFTSPLTVNQFATSSFPAPPCSIQQWVLASRAFSLFLLSSLFRFIFLPVAAAPFREIINRIILSLRGCYRLFSAIFFFFFFAKIISDPDELSRR